MKKNLVNVRLCELAAEKFAKAGNKQQFIETLLREDVGLCPFCGNHWPGKESPAKANIGFRADSALIPKLNGLSKYLSAKINIGLGLCPLCDQSLS